MENEVHFTSDPGDEAQLEARPSPPQGRSEDDVKNGTVRVRVDAETPLLQSTGEDSGYDSVRSSAGGPEHQGAEEGGRWRRKPSVSWS